MKVVGYVRVSTTEQATDGVSLAAQKQKLSLYAELHDLDLVEVIEDAGVSAKTIKRPGLQRALEMLANGEADGLAVVKLDRLSRSVKDWNVLIDKHFGEKAGKSLLSVSDSIDTRTAAGRLVLNVLMSVSQWEREAIGERTRDALQHKKSKGERVGTIPYGYTLADDGCSLIPNESEKAVIAEILRMRANGDSYRAMATELNRRNIPSKSGKGWAHTTVSKIVKRHQSKQQAAA